MPAAGIDNGKAAIILNRANGAALAWSRREPSFDFLKRDHWTKASIANKGQGRDKGRLRDGEQCARLFQVQNDRRIRPRCSRLR